MTDRAQRITYERFKDGRRVAVNVDGARVGMYEIVGGGFLPQGRSMPIKREVDARFMVVLDEAQRRVDDATRMLDATRRFFLKHEVELHEVEDGSAEYDSWLPQSESEPK